MAGRIKALSLYKNILRAHDKFLPHEMKQLGDAYVKSEVSLMCNVCICISLGMLCDVNGIAIMSQLERFLYKL